MHPDEFKNEITALFEQKEGAANNVGSRNGIYGIMYATAPQSIIDGKLTTGSQYTEGGYAAAYYYFGPLGAICFSVLMRLLRCILYQWLDSSGDQVFSYYRMRICKIFSDIYDFFVDVLVHGLF